LSRRAGQPASQRSNVARGLGGEEVCGNAPTNILTPEREQVLLPPLDMKNVGCGLELLRSTPSDSTPLVFLDPQYRENLDRLKFHNEGSRQGDRANLPQMSAALIHEFGVESARVVMPGGYIARWCDKFALAEGLVGIDGLKRVDWLTWDTGTFGMGWRARQRGQHLVFLQKPPIHTRKKKGALRPWLGKPSIPDVWCEKIVNRRHPHQKPFGLLRALIETLSLPGDIIVDPCAGSFVVLDAAHACGRRFLGTDLIGQADAVKRTIRSL
jgi:site-specific DNA-methyltransferase (adenine-specific)